VLSRGALLAPVMWRNAVEIVATIGIVMAVSLADLSTVSAIQQAAPLLVVAGAHLFFGEHIGARRIAALGVGLLGVALVLRPGAAGFDANLMFAVLATVAFAARDLFTRAVPREVQSLQLAVWGSVALVPAGLILLAATAGATGGMTGAGLAWNGAAAAPIALAIVTSSAAYYAITAVMRIGQIGAIAPLRYTRLVFAAALGIVLFGERPDLWTMLGAALIVGSGVYALVRGRARLSAV
jgi:drug/metabolite transporter (DMT)-like permease